MAFTEFTCRASGSNLSAGTLDGSAEASTTPLVTYTNGGWNSGTGVFTPASGNPVSAGVAVGNWVSVYLDGASAPTGFVARVTAVSSTTITLSTTAKSGTAPTTAGTGITAVVGGAWLGPTGASGFPFGFVQSTMTNAAGDSPRVNGKGTNNITAAITHSPAGPVRFQGYTTTFGDGGKWVIDGGTSGANYNLLNLSGANVNLVDLTFQNNGASGGAAIGLSVSGAECIVRRCIFNNLRGLGADLAVFGHVVECEAYLCNQSNTATQGGFSVAGGSGTMLVRCVSHDNAGSNSSGFVGGGTYLNCIADSNGSHGFHLNSSIGAVALGCDAYNNAGDGVRLANSSTSMFYVENCNLVKNGGYGINGSGAGTRNGAVFSCGFGSGSQANTSGTTTGLSAMVESGSVTYTANITPWADPANGDFRITLSTAKGAGRGSFTQTQASYTGTVAYPDIGAAQHLETAGTSGPQRIIGG